MPDAAILKKIIIVMCGGSLGAATRYGVALLAARIWGNHFPWGTLLVNLAGCFLIGLFFGLAEHVRLLKTDLRLFLVTGYLGALTTFSSFALESVTAGRAGMALQPIMNILVNNLGGMGLLLFGLWLGGSMFGS